MRGLEPPIHGCRGGAHVGAHRDVHADVPGDARQDCADDEADGDLHTERGAQDDGDDDADDADGGVLAIQIGVGAFLNGGGDLLHARVAGRLRDDAGDGEYAVENGKDAARNDKGLKRGHFSPIKSQRIMSCCRRRAGNGI